ncbi:MAG: nucleotidyl transferase AbiEii/AbiGii toxin family protein [Bryobacteraceae bacterium]
MAFDRLLARLFQDDPAPWVLKGGYALELRFRTARATVDIDLTVQRVAPATDATVNQIVREMLQEVANSSFGDWFEYMIGTRMMDLDAAPYGGARFPVETRMDGRIFARFHLDAGIGDAIIRPIEIIECRDWLSFAGIIPAQVQTISREQQFAEKLHAYTLPRSSANSRVKDLVDLALLIGSGGLSPARVSDAVDITFKRRRTHALPAALLEPPRDWQGRFAVLAEEWQIKRDMDTVFTEVEEFFGRILKGGYGRPES